MLSFVLFRSVSVALFAGLMASACWQLGCTNDDPCAAYRSCFRTDPVGCCVGDAINVSVCGPCPVEWTEQTSCRTAGCETCSAPLDCQTDLGSGCCGASTFTSDCGECAAGSIPASECIRHYPDECGCDGEAVAKEDTGDPLRCHEDWGGCCGPFVGFGGACGCGVGTRAECNSEFETVVRCLVDAGDGCAGAASEQRCACEMGTLPSDQFQNGLAGGWPRGTEPVQPNVLLLSSDVSGAAQNINPLPIDVEATVGTCRSFVLRHEDRGAPLRLSILGRDWVEGTNAENFFTEDLAGIRDDQTSLDFCPTEAGVFEAVYRLRYCMGYVEFELTGMATAE